MSIFSQCYQHGTQNRESGKRWNWSLYVTWPSQCTNFLWLVSKYFAKTKAWNWYECGMKPVVSHWKVSLMGKYKTVLVTAFKNKCRLTFPHVKSNLIPAHHKRWKKGVDFKKVLKIQRNFFITLKSSSGTPGLEASIRKISKKESLLYKHFMSRNNSLCNKKMTGQV